MTLAYLPHRFDDAALPTVLADLGLLKRSDAIKVMLDAGAGGAVTASLAAAGHRFSEREVDQALEKTTLSISDRFTVKRAVANAGLMGQRA